MSGNPDAPQPSAEVPETITFTSLPALMTSVLLSALLLIFALVGWWAIGPEIRNQITWPQGATLLFFVILMIGIMLSVGYSRLWADQDGVAVRNGPYLRRYRFDEIAGLRMRKGDAWAYLLVKKDGEAVRRAILAVQSLEGAGARRKLRDLRAWLKAHGATSDGVSLAD